MMANPGSIASTPDRKSLMNIISISSSNTQSEIRKSVPP